MSAELLKHNVSRVAAVVEAEMRMQRNCQTVRVSSVQHAASAARIAKADVLITKLQQMTTLLRDAEKIAKTLGDV